MFSTFTRSIVAFCLLVAGCSSSQQQTAQTQQQPQALVKPASTTRTITILHTNDIHANFTPHEATWIRNNPKPMVGGFHELEFAVDSIRKVKSDVLLLDAGDVMTGNPITDKKYKGVEGGALFEMMNMVGYDAWAIGNHDFDISQENLIGLTKIANFPTLSANVVNTKGEFPVNNKEYIIIERGGVKIGVFGLILQGLAGVVNQDNLVGIRVLDLSEAAQKIIDKIDAQTDLIVAVTHNGVSEDSALAMNVRGLDVIVGGHSHSRLTKPKYVNNVVIVQAGRFCENVGELELTVENDRVTKYDGKLIQLWANDSRPKTRLSSFVDSIHAEIEKDYDEVLATLQTDWVRSNDGESNIGNWIADIQRDAARAQVAFMNNGGIRTNVTAGQLTKRKLFAVLPFKNALATFQLTGKQLKGAVAHGLNNDEILQLSGLSVRWKKNASGEKEITAMSVGGKPLNEKANYICAATDFLIGQGKKYLGMEIPQPILLKQTVFDIAVEAARKQKTIASKVEGRIVEVK